MRIRRSGTRALFVVKRQRTRGPGTPVRTARGRDARAGVLCVSGCHRPRGATGGGSSDSLPVLQWPLRQQQRRLPGVRGRGPHSDRGENRSVNGTPMVRDAFRVCNLLIIRTESWCWRGESNPHAHEGRQILSLVRLPVPPLQPVSPFAGRQGTPILADTIPPHNTTPRLEWLPDPMPLASGRPGDLRAERTTG